MFKLSKKIAMFVMVLGVMSFTATLSLNAQSTDRGVVLGATVVSSPVSSATPTSRPTTTTTTTNNGSVNSENTQSNTGVTSPLVIICLVAGAILIIGLLLFLFFRGGDEDKN